METANDLDTPSRFDYSPLDPATRQAVEASRDHIRFLVQRTAGDIIAIGAALLDVKDRLPHGQFGHWLTAEFGWSDRTARNFMRVAEVFGGKPEIVSDLPLRVVYALAGPSVTTEVRERLIDRASTGEPIRLADVRKEVKGIWDEEPEPVPAPPPAKTPHTIWERLEHPLSTALISREQTTSPHHRPADSSLSPLPPRDGLPADKVLRELLILTRMNPAAVAANVRRTDPTLARDCGEFVDRVTEWYTRLVAALQEQRAS